MRSLTILAALLLPAWLAGAAFGDPAVNPPATHSPSIAPPADLLWNAAQACFKKAQYKDAREKFIQFARQFHDDRRRMEALYSQGLSELRMGQAARAEITWQAAVQAALPARDKSPALALILEQLAGYYQLKGRAPDEKKTLDRLLAVFPDHEVTVRLHKQAGDARLADSDYAGALVFYQAVADRLAPPDRRNLELARILAQNRSRDAGTLLALANERLAQNEVELAASLYETLLKQCPDTPEAKTKLAWCCYLARDYDKAEKLCHEVIEAGPPASHWVGKSRWYLIVLAAGPRANVNKAIALCDEQAGAFAGDRLAEQALFTKAWLYWTRKEWAKSKTAFAALLAKYPARGAHPPVQRYIADCENGLSARAGGGK